MSLVQEYNGQGQLFGAFPNLPQMDLGASSIGAVDATGEVIAAIGRVYLSSGRGTSKVFSSAGAKGYFHTAAVVWATGATVVDFGIQDVTAAGLADGVFDVKASLSPGVETIAANAINKFSMETGSKTIAHGDIIAFVIQMVNRGGTDSVTVFRGATSMLPYNTLVGSLVVSASNIVFESDDGTLAFFDQIGIPYIVETSAAFGSGTEAGLAFRFPSPRSVEGFYARMANMAAADDFDVVIYGTPFGTPSALATLSIDAAKMAPTGSSSNVASQGLEVDLLGGTDYVLAIKPTTANTLSYVRLNFGAGNGNITKATMLGPYGGLVSRVGAGAFSALDQSIVPLMGLWTSGYESGSGGGGGTRSYGA